MWQVDETVNHITNECSKLAQEDYKHRHDWVGKRVHWEVCQKSGIKVVSKWYKHHPQRLKEMKNSRFCGPLTSKLTI